MAGARCHSTLSLLAALAFAGCSIVNPDLIYEQRTGVIDAPVAIVAVLPFYPNSRLSQSAKRSGLEAWEAAALVTKFMSEAVASRGFEIIPESDVQTAFAGHGQVTPRSDPIAAARLVASEFGAGAVLLGTVTRYREREGSAYGSMAPASVNFEVTLYEAPSGRRIWRGQFEQTQQTATENFFTSVRYPKGGTRFLTVAQLTRWGAELLANALPLRRIRSS